MTNKFNLFKPTEEETHTKAYFYSIRVAFLTTTETIHISCYIFVEEL